MRKLTKDELKKIKTILTDAVGDKFDPTSIRIGTVKDKPAIQFNTVAGVRGGLRCIDKLRDAGFNMDDYDWDTVDNGVNGANGADFQAAWAHIQDIDAPLFNEPEGAPEGADKPEE